MNNTAEHKCVKLQNNSVDILTFPRGSTQYNQERKSYPLGIPNQEEERFSLPTDPRSQQYPPLLSVKVPSAKFLFSATFILFSYSQVELELL